MAWTNKPYSTIIKVGIISGLGLWLYWPSTEFLLFWDDVPHMQWLAGQTGGRYWLTSAGFPFYRPATFTVWELSEAVLGRHDPRWLHGLSVSLHIINALLLMAVVKRILRDRWAGFWAALVFLTFPFSYQTVIPTPAHFHLWLVFGLLSSGLLLQDWYKRGGSAWRLVMGWLLAFWAVFSHENGVLAPILIGGMIWLANTEHVLAWRTLQWRRMALAIGPIAGFALIYLLMWATVPKANDTNSLQLAALDVKIAQTFQVYGFPIAALLESGFNPDDVVGGLLAGGLFLALVVTWLWLHPSSRGRVGLIALWGLVVMLPAWLFLDAGYLLGSPRLHYLAAVGIATLWGALLAQPFPPRWPVAAQWGGRLAGIAVCLVVAIPFIRARMDEHQQIDAIYREVGMVADDVRADQRLLLINGPAYVAAYDATFPIGAEGSTYLPDFINLGDWLALNGYQPVAADNRRVDDIIPSTSLRFAVTHPALDRATFVDYDVIAHVVALDGELVATQTGQQVVALPRNPVGRYDIGIDVLAINLVQDGDLVRLQVDWRVNEALNTPIEVFAHLLCNGEMVAQADGPPLGRMIPFERWQLNTTWRDYRVFVPQRTVTTGCLGVLVGLWNPNTGERYSIALASGALADGIYATIG